MEDSLIYSLISVCEHISLYRTIDSELNSNSSIGFFFFFLIIKMVSFETSITAESKTQLP